VCQHTKNYVLIYAVNGREIGCGRGISVGKSKREAALRALHFLSLINIADLGELPPMNLIISVWLNNNVLTFRPLEFPQQLPSGSPNGWGRSHAVFLMGFGPSRS